MATRLGGPVGVHDPPAPAPAPPPPPLPAAPAAPPFHCTDRAHCRLAVVGAAAAPVPCPTANLTNCLQVPVVQLPSMVQPNTYNNTAHAPGAVQICTDCRQHGTAHKRGLVNRRAGVGTIVGPPIPPAVAPPGSSVGARADLCTDCIRQEMILYWHRVGTPRPVVPNTNTMWWIARWPIGNAGPASRQDLCICTQFAVNDYALNRCHACRNACFDHLRTQNVLHNEDILGTRKNKIIVGKERCAANGGAGQALETPTNINNRLARGIGRTCPCGKNPKIRPNATHFIDVCLACMGVRVNPANIPRDLQRDELVSPNGRQTRSHPAAVAANTVHARTKGRRHAPRQPHFRVNIECGWMTDPNPPHAGDPFIGGQ